jgi:hypothetical protein
MKSWITAVFVLAIAALLITLFLTGSSAERFAITANGQPKARIVTGEKPPETVAFAARELQTFIKKMSGAELPIAAKPDPKSPSILLGPPAREKIPAAELEKIKRDGYIITVTNGDLCVVGIDDSGPQTDIEELLKQNTEDLTLWMFNRGTLYGAYRLLEELGMRWFMPGELGERAPEIKSLSFSGDIRENPHFITRTVGSWRLHKGYYKDIKQITVMPGERAEIGFEPVENRIWLMRMRGETFRIPLNHNPPRAGWAARFATNHPDYFALQSSGKRVLEHGGHLCYTHPGVLRENIEDIKAFAAGKTAVERGIPSTARNSTNLVYPYNRNWSYDIALDRYYSVLPNDGFIACSCPECLKMIPTNAVPDKQRYSSLVWPFVAKSAEAVPEMNITCLAYGSYAIPYPGMQKLPPNVTVGYCAFSHPSSLLYKDMFDQYEKAVKEWAELTHGNLAFWQHYLGSNRSEENVGMPEHTPEIYAKVIRTMAKFGNHAFCEQMADSVMFELFNRYLLHKLFFNPNLDEKEIFNDYVMKFYGPQAGPLIGEIYADIGNKCVEKYKNRYAAYSFWEKLFDVKTMKGYQSKADLALKKARGEQYKKSVTAFKKYYLGLMERGRLRYADPLALLLESFNPEFVCRPARKPVTVDGKLDEPIWKSSPAVTISNNLAGKAVMNLTAVKTCYDSQHVYFAVSASNPGMTNRAVQGGDPGTADGIDIYLDVPHDHRGYYRVGIDLTGKIYDSHCVDINEPARAGWDSKATAAVVLSASNYVMEAAIPLESLEAPESNLSAYDWGALIARIQVSAAITNDRLSSTSRLLRDSFNQPNYFNNLRFTDR